MIKINGVAHTNITVSNWAACREFYDKLLPFLGMTCVFSGTKFIYYVGGRTALGIGQCDPEYEKDRFVHNSEDFNKVHAHLIAIGATIVQPPEDGGWAPGYYSVLFEDPVGTRLEVNFVPGQGVLADGAGFDPSGDFN